MKESLISFETAMLAKEAGVNLGGYLNVNIENPPNMNSNYNPMESQPWFINMTQSLLQKILREVYKIHIEVTPIIEDEDGEITSYDKPFGYSYIILSSLIDPDENNDDENDTLYSTYEEALEGGSQEALRIIINQINNNEKS